MLDLGGGTGSFLALLRQHSALAGDLYDAPAVAALARQRLAGSPSESRLRIVEGDFFTDPLPQDPDAILIANVFHNFLPERNRAVLRRLWTSAPAERDSYSSTFGPIRHIPSPSPLRSWQVRFCSQAKETCIAQRKCVTGYRQPDGGPSNTNRWPVQRASLWPRKQNNARMEY